MALANDADQNGRPLQAACVLVAISSLPRLGVSAERRQLLLRAQKILEAKADDDRVANALEAKVHFALYLAGRVEPSKMARTAALSKRLAPDDAVAGANTFASVYRKIMVPWAVASKSIKATYATVKPTAAQVEEWRDAWLVGCEVRARARAPARRAWGCDQGFGSAESLLMVALPIVIVGSLRLPTRHMGSWQRSMIPTQIWSTSASSMRSQDLGRCTHFLTCTVHFGTTASLTRSAVWTCCGKCGNRLCQAPPAADVRDDCEVRFLLVRNRSAALRARRRPRRRVRSVLAEAR